MAKQMVSDDASNGLYEIMDDNDSNFTVSDLDLQEGSNTGIPVKPLTPIDNISVEVVSSPTQDETTAATCASGDFGDQAGDSVDFDEPTFSTRCVDFIFLSISNSHTKSMRKLSLTRC